MEDERRWPVVYDEEQLSSTILEMQSSTDVSKNYYQSISDGQPRFCQGDIVELVSKIPVIGKEGKAAAIESTSNYWLVVGNTCDFTRDEVSWVGISPIREATALGEAKLDPIRQFKTSRLYHVKPWSEGVSSALVVDFTQAVSISKSSLINHVKVLARLRFESWMLLHCCLVRYLARDDGRNS